MASTADAFLAAIEAQDIEAVKVCIRRGADVNATIQDNFVR